MKHEPTPVHAARRRWFATAGAVGAAAAAASILPAAPRPAAEAASPTPAPRRGGGYHASAHVQRYYDTTRV